MIFVNIANLKNNCYIFQVFFQQLLLKRNECLFILFFVKLNSKAYVVCTVHRRHESIRWQYYLEEIEFWLRIINREWTTCIGGRIIESESMSWWRCSALHGESHQRLTSTISRWERLPSISEMKTNAFFCWLP